MLWQRYLYLIDSLNLKVRKFLKNCIKNDRHFILLFGKLYKYKIKVVCDLNFNIRNNYEAQDI